MFDIFAEILDLPTEIKTETEEVSPESKQTIPLGNNWSSVEIKKENNQQVGAPAQFHNIKTEMKCDQDETFKREESCKNRKDPGTKKCQMCGKGFLMDTRLQKHYYAVHSTEKYRIGEPMNPNWKRRLG